MSGGGLAERWRSTRGPLCDSRSRSRTARLVQTQHAAPRRHRVGPPRETAGLEQTALGAAGAAGAGGALIRSTACQCDAH